MRFHLTTVALLSLTLAGCNKAADQMMPTANAPSPDMAEPDTVEPDMAEPDMAAPDMASTDLTAPETDAPETASADVTEPSDDNTAIESVSALCTLVAIGDSKVKGAIRFVQEGEMVRITGEVTGLEPGRHGFHVHEKGDLSDKETGKSAGGHFNPTDQPHGKKADGKRHVGDLGNIDASDEGVATISMEDNVVSLTGENSIVGKSIVIHAGEDKFTQPSGDAGDRVAFGLIESE